ncbi:hypothetical protein HY625_01000 [Candidatus Uhrbacteria bacterium]|nr:hypothetical protein [Candidatus Uhrbacteria bacterium]
MQKLFIALFSALLVTAMLPAHATVTPTAPHLANAAAVEKESPPPPTCVGAGCIETYAAKVGGDAGYQIIGGVSILPAAVGAIVRGLLGSLGIIFLILIIWGGYQWMTATGNEETVEKSKKVITQAVIGLVIVLGSYMLYAFIGQYLGLIT